MGPSLAILAAVVVLVLGQPSAGFAYDKWPEYDESIYKCEMVAEGKARVCYSLVNGPYAPIHKIDAAVREIMPGTYRYVPVIIFTYPGVSEASWYEDTVKVILITPYDEKGDEWYLAVLVHELTHFVLSEEGTPMKDQHCRMVRDPRTAIVTKYLDQTEDGSGWYTRSLALNCAMRGEKP